MALTIENFRGRFAIEAPALALAYKTEAQEDLDAYLGSRLTFWETRLSSEAWGASHSEAVLLRVAHERQLILDRASGNRESGRVALGEQVGQWSKTFSSSAPMSPERQALQQTDWGQAFLALEPTSIGGFIVTS